MQFNKVILYNLYDAYKYIHDIQFDLKQFAYEQILMLEYMFLHE